MSPPLLISTNDSTICARFQAHFITIHTLEQTTTDWRSCTPALKETADFRQPWTLNSHPANGKSFAGPALLAQPSDPKRGRFKQPAEMISTPKTSKRHNFLSFPSSRSVPSHHFRFREVKTEWQRYARWEKWEQQTSDFGFFFIFRLN